MKMAEWIYGYGTDHEGNITYKSIDCSNCNGVFKVKTYDEQDYWKERFKFCPFCGEEMRGEGNG